MGEFKETIPAPSHAQQEIARIRKILYPVDGFGLDSIETVNKNLRVIEDYVTQLELAGFRVSVGCNPDVDGNVEVGVLRNGGTTHKLYEIRLSDEALLNDRYQNERTIRENIEKLISAQ